MITGNGRADEVVLEISYFAVITDAGWADTVTLAILSIAVITGDGQADTVTLKILSFAMGGVLGGEMCCSALNLEARITHVVQVIIYIFT